MKKTVKYNSVPRPLDYRIEFMIEYLKIKVEERDWHGVCDASNDLRELEVEKRIRDELTVEVNKSQS